MTNRAGRFRVRFLGGPNDGQEWAIDRLQHYLLLPVTRGQLLDVLDLQFRPPAPTRPQFDRAVYLRLRHPEARGEEQAYRFSHYE